MIISSTACFSVFSGCSLHGNWGHTTQLLFLCCSDNNGYCGCNGFMSVRTLSASLARAWNCVAPSSWAQQLSQCRHLGGVPSAIRDHPPHFRWWLQLQESSALACGWQPMLSAPCEARGALSTRPIGSQPVFHPSSMLSLIAVSNGIKNSCSAWIMQGNQVIDCFCPYKRVNLANSAAQRSAIGQLHSVLGILPHRLGPLTPASPTVPSADANRQVYVQGMHSAMSSHWILFRSTLCTFNWCSLFLSYCLPSIYKAQAKASLVYPQSA